MTTKGEAVCLALGETVTEANYVKYKFDISDTPFDVVYTSERGNRASSDILKKETSSITTTKCIMRGLIFQNGNMQGKKKDPQNVLNARIEYLRSLNPSPPAPRSSLSPPPAQETSGRNICNY